MKLNLSHEEASLVQLALTMAIDRWKNDAKIMREEICVKSLADQFDRQVKQAERIVADLVANG